MSIQRRQSNLIKINHSQFPYPPNISSPPPKNEGCGTYSRPRKHSSCPAPHTPRPHNNPKPLPYPPQSRISKETPILRQLFHNQLFVKIPPFSHDLQSFLP